MTAYRDACGRAPVNLARWRPNSDLKSLKVLPTAADAGYVSTSPRATFSRSVALGLGLVVAILLLGKALVGLVDLPAPVEQLLGGGSDNAIQLSETPVRPAEQSSLKIGHPRAAATGSDSVALVPATRSRSSAATQRKAGRRTSSSVRRSGRGVGNAGTATLPSANTPAPSTGQDPVAASPAPSSGSTPVASSARKMKLSVANVSSASGSTASAGGARMRITLADAATGGAPATATAGVTPAVDLQLGLTARDLAALAGATPPQGPVVLRARLDVVDETSAGTAPQMRVRMELAPTDTQVQVPTVAESGDDGGLSNAVEVLIPVDSSQMFRRGDRHRGGNGPVETPTALPAAEVRLPLATATADQPAPETPAPVSDGAQLSLPDSGGTTDGAAALQVAVQLETVTPPAPPSDPAEPSEPAPTPTPEPTPEPTPQPTPEPTPTPTPEPTPADAPQAAPATDPAPATEAAPQAAEATPAPAEPQATATPQAAAPAAEATPAG